VGNDVVTSGSRAVTWTVVTWNAHGSAEPPIGPAAAALAALQADVIALQEVRPAQAAGIANALGAAHVWRLGHYVPTWPWRLRTCAEGLAIVTPHVLRPEAIEVISRRRSRWSWRRRIQIEALVERSDHSAYRLINAHLSPGRLGAERRAESARVAARAGRVTSPAAIVAGDLNDAGEPVVAATIEAAGVRDAWSAAGVEPALTNPSSDPYQTLDHVLVPASASDVTVDVPPGNWAEWSDHLPVRATFTLQWAAGDFI
jgi:endonuclease/exonuclease/phosphatase family metal-dependent hydrolase